ncbi:hypothetical protein [Sphingomonas sp.]|jgi:alpha-D-ribose 1-methylphosphonate 5-triphosphate synthase subunit PhnG|uniref:hypothetical protein n=1 Tax=Sphingomonas sp. TaxID=28214 RepID=UPI0035C82F51
MNRPTLFLLPLALAACDDGGSTYADAKLVKAARAGMMAVQGMPGGKTSTFTQVRLIGGATVCGMIDGNDGDGPRAFSAKGQDVLIEDKRDPATKAAIVKACVGQPVHEIVSRNAQFTDLAVKH